MGDVEVMHMTDTKRNLLQNLNDNLNLHKNKRRNLIQELGQIEKQIDEITMLITELMGLPMERTE